MDRYEFHPYEYEPSSVKRSIFGLSLHNNGKCDYHPYEQEQDIRMANLHHSLLFNMSDDVREWTLMKVHEAQRRLSKHYINWQDSKVLAEVSRREGELVEVSPTMSQMVRPPDADYWGNNDNR